MASTRQLKSRIRSVGNTKQITKAMQMVAASKMRRSQETQRAGQPYARAAREILTYLASQGVTEEHPLFVKRDIKKRLLIVIASDKGLAGAYNANIIKQYLKELQADKAHGVETLTIEIGRKVAQFTSRLKDVTSVGTYVDLPDNLDGSEFGAVLRTASELYRTKQVDAVDVVFTEFVSGMLQVATTERILPAGFKKTKVSDAIRTAKYEPSLSEVLDGVAYRLVGAQIFHCMAEARASEHSMRMIAMKNATDNASDLVDDLTLAMNKARQGAITQELSEISAGVEAMK